MSSDTTFAAVQYRFQEWAAQIRECQNRPDGMRVTGWCASRGISKVNYYYRLRRVRAACLENLPAREHRQIVPVEFPHIGGLGGCLSILDSIGA